MHHRQPESAAPSCGAEERPHSAGVPPTVQAPAGASATALFAAAQEDSKLAALLLDLPPSERLAAAGRDPRFHRQTLATLLVLRAEAALGDAAGDGGETAELAVAVASALPAPPAGKPGRTAALACWLWGKALLRAKDYRLADHAFRSMFAFIPGTGPSEERALACTGLAQLNADTDRPEVAAAHFLLAAQLFWRLASPAPAAACEAQLGFLLLETGDLLAARFALRAALHHLDDEAFAPSLAARMRLALARIGATLSGAAASDRELRRARRLYRLESSPAEDIERAWWEGRIAAAAGALADAERLFERVRLELLARGSLGEAVRITWDQVQLRLDAGRADAIHDLTGDLAAAWRPAGESWAREMTALAHLAGAQAPAFYSASFDFRRRLRRPTLPDPGRPDLLTPSRALADRLLRRRGEHEDPLGAASGL